MVTKNKSRIDAEFAQQITDECMSGDKERDHGRADDILCKLLTKLGFAETVKAYSEVGNWYA